MKALPCSCSPILLFYSLMTTQLFRCNIHRIPKTIIKARVEAQTKQSIMIMEILYKIQDNHDNAYILFPQPTP